MARQTNGTTHTLTSAATVNLSGSQKCALSFWLWWVGYANDDDLALDFGTGSSAGGFTVDPNAASSTRFTVFTYDAGASNLASTDVNRTEIAAGQWNHIVVNFDRALAGGTAVHEFYINGAAAVDNNHNSTGNPTGNFGNLTLYLMSRSGSSLFGAGRIAEVALWSGIELSSGNVSSLYNSGAGVVATSVQSGSLAYYWPLCGAASPEPATTGGVDMTVTGALEVSHPISGADICPRSRPMFRPA